MNKIHQQISRLCLSSSSFEYLIQNEQDHFASEGQEKSRKTFYREFKKVIDASDIIIEVLDARDPLGCRCPQVEEAVLTSGKNKKLILLLNKIGMISTIQNLFFLLVFHQILFHVIILING